MKKRGTLAWSQRVLFSAAFLLLGYFGVALVSTWAFQNRQRLLLDAELARPMDVSKAPLLLSTGDLMGRIEIPRLHLSAIVIEGTSRQTLQRAVGHIAGTSMPGGPGNVALSGHRDSFFRPLRDVKPSDLITVTTLAGKFNYRVVSTQVVDPSDLSVLDSSDKQTLTLITCYPFYFVGSAPERFIVRAERHI